MRVQVTTATQGCERETRHGTATPWVEAARVTRATAAAARDAGQELNTHPHTLKQDGSVMAGLLINGLIREHVLF